MLPSSTAYSIRSQNEFINVEKLKTLLYFNANTKFISILRMLAGIVALIAIIIISAMYVCHISYF